MSTPATNTTVASVDLTAAEVRVRFAPSPTGTLHLGGARTAIYNWAFARKCGGSFILRIDDTDPERSTQENVTQILRSLSWLGLDWDEGVQVDGSIRGNFGPYFQTQRNECYTRALEHMIANGSVYRCFCTAEQLAAKRDAARAAGKPSGYDRSCRKLDPSTAHARAEAGEPFVWRLRVPDGRGAVVVNDLVRGSMEFPADALDDLVLVRSDGTPTYNFASVVDDVDMAISHIIRGDDHVSNTPRQILIFEALRRPVPAFAHLSMIWGSDGKKLSKRHGATGVEEYAKLGYLPDAMLNGLALLGWSLDGETTIISPKALKENFSLSRISKNPAIFDAAKLEWINGVYIREMAPVDFAQAMLPWLEDEGLADKADFAARRKWYEELAPLVSERIKLMTEVVPMVRFLFLNEIEIDEIARVKVLDKKPEESRQSLLAATDALDLLPHWTTETIDAALHVLPAKLNLKPRVVFQALRVAITGTMVSPPLFESLSLLGRERTLARLRKALAS